MEVNEWKRKYEESRTEVLEMRCGTSPTGVKTYRL